MFPVDAILLKDKTELQEQDLSDGKSYEWLIGEPDQYEFVTFGPGDSKFWGVYNKGHMEAAITEFQKEVTRSFKENSKLAKFIK